MRCFTWMSWALLLVSASSVLSGCSLPDDVPMGQRVTYQWAGRHADRTLDLERLRLDVRHAVDRQDYLHRLKAPSCYPALMQDLDHELTSLKQDMAIAFYNDASHKLTSLASQQKWLVKKMLQNGGAKHCQPSIGDYSEEGLLNAK